MTEATAVPPPLSPPKTAGLAISSLVLGILSFFCLGPLTGIPAIILGVVAQQKIAASGGALGGNGLAIAGIVSGAAGIFFTMILLAIAIPAFNQTAVKARVALSLNNAKQIALACQMYAEEHDGELPRNLEVLVEEDLLPRKTLNSPLADDREEISYKLLVSGKISDFEQPALVALLHDIHPTRKGEMVFAMLDGRVTLGQTVGKVPPPQPRDAGEETGPAP